MFVMGVLVAVKKNKKTQGLVVLLGFRVARRSKAMLLIARGVTIVPGSNPGCIKTRM
jgi:hypothetical protein